MRIIDLNTENGESQREDLRAQGWDLLKIFRDDDGHFEFYDSPRDGDIMPYNIISKEQRVINNHKLTICNIGIKNLDGEPLIDYTACVLANSQESEDNNALAQKIKGAKLGYEKYWNDFEKQPNFTKNPFGLKEYNVINKLNCQNYSENKNMKVVQDDEEIPMVSMKGDVIENYTQTRIKFKSGIQIHAGQFISVGHVYGVIKNGNQPHKLHLSENNNNLPVFKWIKLYRLNNILAINIKDKTELFFRGYFYDNQIRLYSDYMPFSHIVGFNPIF